MCCSVKEPETSLGGAKPQLVVRLEGDPLPVVGFECSNSTNNSIRALIK